MSSKTVPVSVVIPCYLCVDTIDRAVESVMAQTTLPTEIWLIDDGSPDDGRTLARLHDLCERFRLFTSISTINLDHNRGSGAARNAGLDASTQPYVAFLDADDSWLPTKLEVQYEWMRIHPEVVMTGHGWKWLRRPGVAAQSSTSGQGNRVTILSQLLSNKFYTPTVMVRRDLHYRFVESRWDGQYVLEDMEMWLRIVLNGHPTWRLGDILTYIHKAPFGDGGLSGDLWKMERSQLNAYWRQVEEGRLATWVFLSILPWLIAKFVRRTLLVALNRRPTSR